mmetsp:Transcript_4732/g.8088  ORF Transcript_4732/g.8088 Transcript_4732/m.8088 type:complete len:112 (+) Transcript_4732:519-854(+)
MRKEIEFEVLGSPTDITVAEFNKRVHSGEKLVVLDDMVLDVTKFLDEHPGGKFSLENNIGRDVSKFFHGGYSLEVMKKVANHTHSSDARKIVNKLVVGRLQGLNTVKLMKI